MRCFLFTGMWLTFPVGQICRRFFGQTFPPYFTVVSYSNVGVDHVFVKRSHTVRVGLGICTRCYTEETSFRVDCVQTTIFTWFDPGNIVTYSFNLPAFIACWWNQHRKVGFTTSRRECSCDIVLFTW